MNRRDIDVAQLCKLPGRMSRRLGHPSSLPLDLDAADHLLCLDEEISELVARRIVYATRVSASSEPEALDRRFVFLGRANRSDQRIGICSFDRLVDRIDMAMCRTHAELPKELFTQGRRNFTNRLIEHGSPRLAPSARFLVKSTHDLCSAARVTCKQGVTRHIPVFGPRILRMSTRAYGGVMPARLSRQRLRDLAIELGRLRSHAFQFTMLRKRVQP